MSQFFNNSIFWIDVDKIQPNPYQPRRDFDSDRLRDLADSIRMYGVLQPLVVGRKETVTAEGGMAVLYELISGERRLRASKIAGLLQVPVIIRSSADDSRVKLELAIIENLQREDLNAVDRARAFKRLIDEFGFKQGDVGAKVGKSREYVSNTLRVLLLPEEIIVALSEGKISEGHSRPLLMLIERPEEQQTLFKDIMLRKMSVRDAERAARHIAVERVRRKSYIDPVLRDFEEKLAESLGARVYIEKSEKGGTVKIGFFSNEDLANLVARVLGAPTALSEISTSAIVDVIPASATAINEVSATVPDDIAAVALDDRSSEDKEKAETELYSIKNFTV